MDDGLNLYEGEIVPVGTNGKNDFEELWDRVRELPLDDRAKLVSDLIPSTSDFMSSNVTINLGTNTNITNNHTSDFIVFQPGISAEEVSKQLERFSQEDLSKLIEAIAIRMRQDKRSS